MRTMIYILLVILSACLSGCSISTQAPRPCTTIEDTDGRDLELVMKKTGETLHLAVYKERIPLEVVSVLITDRRPYGVIIQKDGEVIFDERFNIPEEEEISTPMELDLAMLEEGEINDPELLPVIEVAREIPQLEYMPLFNEVFPVRIYWESMYSGLLEYADGKIAKLSFSGTELNECTEEEQERQYELRLNNCDKSWQEYINSMPLRDTDCLLCSLIAIDPCTGVPIDSHAILGCIFGGAIGCGISIGIAVFLWASSAS